MFNVRTRVSENAVSMDLEGVLDSKTAPELEEKITEIGDNVTEMHFDFADLEFLTSAGLRTILYARQLMDDKDGRMTLKNVNSDIMDIFKMTGFLDVLEIVD